MKVVDLKGVRLGRLVVIDRGVKSGKSGKAYWNCLCDCGQSTTARSDHLRSGRIVSCGCRTHEPTSLTHGATGTREHMCWGSMRQRCANPNHKAYKNYGGRGITICPAWDDFAVFLKDMGPSPEGYDLDRIDNNGNYTPENCHWTTRRANMNNRRSCTMLEYLGRTASISIWAEELDLSYAAVVGRLARGWSVELALSTPTKKGWSQRIRK